MSRRQVTRADFELRTVIFSRNLGRSKQIRLVHFASFVVFTCPRRAVGGHSARGQEMHKAGRWKSSTGLGVRYHQSDFTELVVRDFHRFHLSRVRTLRSRQDQQKLQAIHGNPFGIDQVDLSLDRLG